MPPMTQTEVIVKVDKKERIATALGFRRGDRGTHSSRTMMFAELAVLLDGQPTGTLKEDIRRAVVDDNVLGKKTSATRRLTFQRLSELYAFDEQIPVFRVLRRFWEYGQQGRGVLAILCAAARDPLLRSTADAVLSTPVGEVVTKPTIIAALREATGERFNDGSLDKIARNAASSWTQSGHLSGRNVKVRQNPEISAANTAYAFFLGYLEGVRGPSLYQTLWTRMLAASDSRVSELSMEASRRGWMTYRQVGRVIEVTFPGLLTAKEQELTREQS